MAASIVHLPDEAPDDAIESLLISFEGMAAISDGGPAASAELLRSAAESCSNLARRNRLQRAAAALAAGEPCALTQEGLTAKESIAAQTVSLADWEDRRSRPLLPADSAELDYLKNAPPKLPHLPVRHFFRGLIVRAGEEFEDVNGRDILIGDVFQVLNCDFTPERYELTFSNGMTVVIAGNDSIVENRSNARFQPVPSESCLQRLIGAIRQSLDAADAEEDSEAWQPQEPVETLRRRLAECDTWLSQPTPRGPGPQLPAGETFGRDNELASWVPLLFASVKLGDPFDKNSVGEEPESDGPSLPYQKFLGSLNISYSDWRDGAGYDLEALQNATEAEQEAATVMLAERLAATPNWREVEALRSIGTPPARAAIRHAMNHADAQTRLRAAEMLVDLDEPVDLESVIIDALRNSDLSNGLSQAIDLAEQNPSPEIQSVLVDLALNGNDGQRVQCAALALYLGGQSDAAFDWNHRPFFLRFGDENRETQIQAYRELCQRLGLEPKLPQQ